MDDLGAAELGALLHALLDVCLAGLASAQRVLKLVLPRSPALHLHGQVDSGRGAQAKRGGDLLQVELVDVENVPLLVARVGLQVRAVAVLRSLVQVVVLLD